MFAIGAQGVRYAIRHPRQTYNGLKRIYKASGVARYAINKAGNYIGQKLAIGGGAALGAANFMAGQNKRKRIDNDNSSSKKRKMPETRRNNNNYTNRRFNKNIKQRNTSSKKRRKTMSKRRASRKQVSRVGAQRAVDRNVVSVFYKKPKFSKMATWSKQPLTYEQTLTWGLASTGQSVNAVTTIGGITAATALGGSQMLTELYNRHSKIANSTGPAIITVDPTLAIQRYNTLYLKGFKSEINLTNQAPTTCEVDVYVVTRKNSDKTWVTASAVADWQAGLTVMNQAGSTNLTSYFDTVPTRSKRFNMNWRIQAKYYLKMDAGQERKLVYKCNTNRFLDSDHWLNFAGGVKGIYHEIIVVARGPIADATSTKAVGAIATARVKLVGIVKNTYNSTAVQVYSKLLYQSTDLTSGNAALYSIADAAGTVVNTETDLNYA